MRKICQISQIYSFTGYFSVSQTEKCSLNSTSNNIAVLVFALKWLSHLLNSCYNSSQRLLHSASKVVTIRVYVTFCVNVTFCVIVIFCGVTTFLYSEVMFL